MTVRHGNDVKRGVLCTHTSIMIYCIGYTNLYHDLLCTCTSIQRSIVFAIEIKDHT
jgi:hypothetical protein